VPLKNFRESYEVSPEDQKLLGPEGLPVCVMFCMQCLNSASLPARNFLNAYLLACC
jgi:hypothetical protein